MACSSRPNDPGNPGNNEQNIVADALAVMHRRMADQDAKIEEQMNEIQNLRQQLLQQGGEGIGGNGGNPTDIETYDSHIHSEIVRGSYRIVKRINHHLDLVLKESHSTQGLAS